MQFDMILVHAPSVYDFRNRNDILFAYLSNSATVHVSNIFEMPPVGILAIKQHLQRQGFKVDFFNIASKMLSDHDFDVENFFKKVPADYIGIDLHWLAHAHGALELAKLYKKIHPSAKVVMGGISATYYHEELMEFPQVDYVARGYDTLLPIEQLVKSKGQYNRLLQVPNLTWKHQQQHTVNEMSYTPSNYNAVVDWRDIFGQNKKSMTPYNVVIPQSGCEYDCKWCGGSRSFSKKYMGLKKSVAQKSSLMLRNELESITEISKGSHTVTMMDFWHEYSDLFEVGSNVLMSDKIKYVHFMLNRLPTIQKGRSLGIPANAIIELSPDSHDLEVARAGGRGKYSMEEMEYFIDNTLDDVYAFEIYFMIGLPRQTVKSVRETVDYCEHLLQKYRCGKVIPFIGPMLPFLDPGSEIFNNSEKYGYKLFHRTLKEHKDALLNMNWKHRLNYETQWLGRDELVSISYEAVRKLTQLKQKYGMLPEGIASKILDNIDQTCLLLNEIDEYQSGSPLTTNKQTESQIKNKILKYNENQFKKVRSQQRPVDFNFAKQQWFDTDGAFSNVFQ